MTSIAGAKPVGGVKGVARRAGVSVPPLLSTQGALTVLLLTAALVWAFWHFFKTQHLFSSHGQDWSHAYLVPLISAFLLWQNRREIVAIKPTVFWPGLIPLVMSVPCYLLFQLGSLSTHMGQGWAVILAVFGLCLLLTGPRMMTLLFLPICYLAFGVTVAEMVMIKLTFVLQGIAAQGGWITLNLIGVHTDLSGNSLTVWDSKGASHDLNIAEACSGMRMVIAFAALGVAVALVSLKYWWQRIALILLGLPVAVGMNIVRVAVLGVASLYDAELSRGQAHMFIGFALLILAFFLFMGVASLLKKTVHEPKVKQGPSPAAYKPGPVDVRAMLRPAFVASMSLLLATAIGLTAALGALGIFLKKEQIFAPGNRGVEKVPTETDSWIMVGKPNESLSEEFVEELGTSNYLMRVYEQKKAEPGKPKAMVQLHLAYYTGMVDTVPHVPERCMTAHGLQPVSLAEELPVPLEKSTWRTDDKAAPDAQGHPVYTGRTGRYSDAPNLRVRLPRGLDDLHMRFSTFDVSGDQRTVAGYFFMANGGLTPSPEGVRVLAFKLQDDYAYYLKVQTTVNGAIDSKEAARITGQLLSELMPEIARCAPDWVEVESGNYPPDNPRKHATK
jgi:exosortase